MNILNVIIFIIGLAGTIRLEFIGDIFLTDVLLSPLSLLLFTRLPRRFCHGLLPILFLLSLFWLTNQILTDIYRGTPFEDYARGWSKIVVFILNFCGLLYITDLRINRIIIFFLGFSISLIVQTRFYPTEFQSTYDFAPGAWKFGLSPAIMFLSVAFSAVPIARQLLGFVGSLVPFMFVGLLNLVFDFRSAFGIVMLASAFGIIKKFILDSSPRIKAAITPRSFFFIIAGGVIFAQGLIFIYSTAAENGWIGNDAKAKYATQTSGELSLLMSGRPEALVSIQAIIDAPILGHGSWKQDTYYVALLVDILASKGIVIGPDVFDRETYIPAHSHILGSWVEGGIMGGVFWAVVLAISVVAIYRTLKSNDTLATLISFVLFLMMWDILFSPFGASQRFVKPAQICLALAVLERSIRNKQSPEPVPENCTGR